MAPEAPPGRLRSPRLEKKNKTTTLIVHKEKIIECGAAGGIIQLNNGSQIGWCRRYTTSFAQEHWQKKTKNPVIRTVFFLTHGKLSVDNRTNTAHRRTHSVTHTWESQE